MRTLILVTIIGAILNLGCNHLAERVDQQRLLDALTNQVAQSVAF